MNLSHWETPLKTIIFSHHLLISCIVSERQSIPSDVETGIATRLQESSDGEADAQPQPQEQEEERATGQVSREAGHMDAKSRRKITAGSKMNKGLFVHITFFKRERVGNTDVRAWKVFFYYLRSMGGCKIVSLLVSLYVGSLTDVSPIVT